jgi:HAMP domain-containing protein
MPVWIPLLIQLLPFFDNVVKLIITALRKKPTERRERLAQRLENVMLRHKLDRNEETLEKDLKEIQVEIQKDDC